MIEEKHRVLEFVRSLPDGTIFNCKEIKETRSQNQNRLLWKWYGDLVQEFAEDGIHTNTDDIHDLLKKRCIESEFKQNTLTGEMQEIEKSTTKLNKGEFSKFLKNAELFLLQTFNVSHALPGEFLYDK